MKNITHIFFDLDHTLWDTDKNSEESLRELFHELDLQATGIPDFESFHSSYRQHNNRLWGLYAENKVGRDAVRLHRFIHTLSDFNIHTRETAESISDRFMERTPHKKYLIEGAVEVLEYLSAKYYVAVITNGFSETQHIKLRGSGLDHHFSKIFISEEIGAHKPDPVIYMHAMKLSGAAKAENCLMIGDTYTTDVIGAVNAGWHAVHLLPDGAPHGDPVITIRKLEELKSLL